MEPHERIVGEYGLHVLDATDARRGRAPTPLETFAAGWWARDADRGLEEIRADQDRVVATHHRHERAAA